MATSTGSSLVLTFTVPGYSTGPTVIRGFGPDSTVDGEALTVGEVIRGIDGFSTSAHYNTTLATPFELLATSPSIAFMDGWMGARLLLNNGVGDDLPAINGVISYPSLGTQFQLNNGTLTSFKPLPQGQRMLRPRSFTIVWGTWSPMTQI